MMCVEIKFRGIYHRNRLKNLFLLLLKIIELYYPRYPRIYGVSRNIWFRSGFMIGQGAWSWPQFMLHYNRHSPNRQEIPFLSVLNEKHWPCFIDPRVWDLAGGGRKKFSDWRNTEEKWSAIAFQRSIFIQYTRTFTSRCSSIITLVRQNFPVSTWWIHV